MTDKNWFDPNTYLDLMKSNDFSAFMPAAKVPGFDAEAVTEAYKKNIQAFVDANRVAAEGYQGVAKKQMDAVQLSMSEANVMMKDTASAPLSTDGFEKGVEAAKAQFEKSVEVFGELADSTRQIGEDAFAILQTRATESMEEMKELSTKSMEALKPAA